MRGNGKRKWLKKEGRKWEMRLNEGVRNEKKMEKKKVMDGKNN